MATLKAHGLLIIDQINATYCGLGFVCGTLEKEVKSIVHACFDGFPISWLQLFCVKGYMMGDWSLHGIDLYSHFL